MNRLTNNMIRYGVLEKGRYSDKRNLDNQGEKRFSGSIERKQKVARIFVVKAQEQG